MNNALFLGAFAKLLKATISFVTSVCLSVRMEQLGSHWTDFHEIWYLNVFETTCRENSSFKKSDRKNGYFTWRSTHFHPQYSLKWEIFKKKKLYRKSSTHFILKNFFLTRTVCEIMRKNFVHPDRPHTTMWRMRIACSVTTSTSAQ